MLWGNDNSGNHYKTSIPQSIRMKIPDEPFLFAREASSYDMERA